MKLSACDLEVYTKLVQIRNELANESRSIDRRDIAQRLSLVMENFVTIEYKDRELNEEETARLFSLLNN